MSTYKNLTARGVWGDQQRPLFILGLLYISVTNVAMIWHTCTHLGVLAPGIRHTGRQTDRHRMTAKAALA